MIPPRTSPAAARAGRLGAGGVTLALALCAASSAALAHGGLQAGAGTLRLADGIAHVHLAPAPSAFAAFDTDGDGDLEADEITAQRDAVVAHAVAAFAITAADGTAPEVVLADVNLPAHLHEGEAPYVRVTLQLAWPTDPCTLHLQWAHADVAPLTVRAFRNEGCGIGATGVVELTEADSTGTVF